ncbi:hypothetical protein B4589_002350 [Halolamina sp. CBA1230]|uniref:hypothetical protein n=1 Tax=Halolamina sp. CBA1230 TaxID=1853690 RepID=UPI0009A236A5|nr:hypothetical protein [Halolamina sp. CBA1230]QKY19272.1 hypothetical protein B4589_002350 [Halolamina sp. CBA1230]
MRDPNPRGPRPTVSDTSAPGLGDSWGMLLGTLFAGVVLLGGLLTAVTSPALFTGLVIGLGVGVAAGVVTTRRRASLDSQLCLPRTGVCVRI